MAARPPKIALIERWFIALTALALMVQVLVPPGFMVSSERGSGGLVICTGHGPMRSMDHPAPGKAPRPAGGICAFAAHGTAAPGPAVVVLQAVSFGYMDRPVTQAPDLAPGRGLAAPPPQSHAPPIILI